eukprot:6938958-Karenia_brevis.AAC.1
MKADGDDHQVLSLATIDRIIATPGNRSFRLCDPNAQVFLSGGWMPTWAHDALAGGVPTPNRVKQRMLKPKKAMKYNNPPKKVKQRMLKTKKAMKYNKPHRCSLCHKTGH